jgi:hypothetical protein
MTIGRHFLKALATGGVGLFVRGKPGEVLAHIRGGSLNPRIPKYRTPMLIPPVMPLAGTVTDKSGRSVDYYEISVKQFSQPILPNFPATTLWGYGPCRFEQVTSASHSQRAVAHHGGEVG